MSLGLVLVETASQNWSILYLWFKILGSNVKIVCGHLEKFAGVRQLLWKLTVAGSVVNCLTRLGGAVPSKSLSRQSGSRESGPAMFSARHRVKRLQQSLASIPV